jgi:dihydrofolate synthase / folylpolyglutamate synthase
MNRDKVIWSGPETVGPEDTVTDAARSDEWLEYIGRIHSSAVCMGLDRIEVVRSRLSLHPEFPIVTVGGTNGKGSTCAMLEAMLSAAGYRVGCYTSPHLLAFNERIRINRCHVSDDQLTRAFARVEEARGKIPLTFFEFTTLAAMVSFLEVSVDAAVLEVGLGGRLDAVNAFSPDCAVITGVAIDHVDYLGSSREEIALEKAGIFRANRPAVCADFDVPKVMRKHAGEVEAHFLEIGVDFGIVEIAGRHHYWGPHGTRRDLPSPRYGVPCQLRNACAAIAALETLQSRLPRSVDHGLAGLRQVGLPARFQVIPGEPTLILDVAHNPQAARVLAENLAGVVHSGRKIAVFGMLRDKDIGAVIYALKSQIDVWFVGAISAERGASAVRVKEELEKQGIRNNVFTYDDPGAAYRFARDSAGKNDVILVFGSFYTVSAVLNELGDAVPPNLFFSDEQAWPTSPVPSLPSQSSGNRA